MFGIEAPSPAGVERVVERGAENPSVLGAVVALSCGIGAGSGPKAWEHASCKRQVSGSNPLTGPQVNEGFAASSRRPRGTPKVTPGVVGIIDAAGRLWDMRPPRAAYPSASSRGAGGYGTMEHK